MKSLFTTFLMVTIVGLATASGQTKLLTAAMTPYCINGCSSQQTYGVKNVLDRNVNTKFADSIKTSTGFFVDTKIDSRVTKLELTTADDAPENDPSGFKLMGSNDGTSWVEIYEGNIPCNSPRLYTWGFTFTNFAIFSWYRVEFTGVCNTALAKGMQVAEVQLFRSSITLPVKLLLFDGIVNNNYAKLTWALAQPEEGTTFEVEQSANGQVFYSVDTAIQSRLSTRFSYTGTKKLNGAAYFRLKTTDRSGEVTYSAVLMLRTISNIPGIRAFPNPAKKGQLVYVSGSNANAESWALYNLGGIKVAAGKCNPSMITSIAIPAGITSGVYLLYIKANTNISIQKLVVE